MMGEPYRSFIPSIFQRLHGCLQLFQMMPRHIGTDLEKYPINKNTSMIHLRYIYDTYMIHISMIHLWYIFHYGKKRVNVKTWHTQIFEKTYSSKNVYLI